MPLGCWRKAARVLSSPPRTPSDDRPESSLWGTSRPDSAVSTSTQASTRQGRVPRLRLHIPSPLGRGVNPYANLEPLPPGPDGLRPLRLVEAQKARASAQAAPPAVPQSIELSDLAYLKPSAPPTPAADVVQPGGVLFAAEDEVAWPASPQRCHYDVTRPPSLRPSVRDTQRLGPTVVTPTPMGPSTPFLGRYPALPHVAPLPEWADSVPQPVRRLAPLPPLQPVQRSAPTQAQHQAILAHLRAQGSFLPDVLNQAERGHPLMVPPRTSSLPRR